MAEANLERLSVEELIQYVWRHWQETNELAKAAVSRLTEWGESPRGSRAVACRAIFPLKGVLLVSVPQIRELLSMRLSLWKTASRRERRREEAAVRMELWGYLQDSDKTRRLVAVVLRQYGLG